ncbi:hypothetical protein ACHAXH_001010 [Discostella pseudostelligera]
MTTMLLARSTLLRRTAALPALSSRHHHRKLTTSSSPYKRALSKTQLEGSKNADAKPPPVAAAAAPLASAAAPSAPAAAGGGGNKVAGGSGVGGGGSGGGGGALLPLLALGGVGLGGAYYNDLIPQEYLPDILKKANDNVATIATKMDNKKVPAELREVVEEVATATKESPASPIVSTPVVESTNNVADAPKLVVKEIAAVEKEEEELISLEHPENGNRVNIDKINTFYQTVNTSRAKEEEALIAAAAAAAAARATQYTESNETRAISTAAEAMSELQSTATLQNSQTLNAANAALRSDLDATYFTNLEQLTPSELRVRVIQLATEMADRTKWEAVRLKEFLSMKEKEVGDKYLEILQKQRLEYEALLAQKLRDQEDAITRQANAALAAKEENIQSLIKATNEARDNETQEILANETKRITSELEWEYTQKLQNELAQLKQSHAAELEKHLTTMTNLQSKLSALERRLELSLNYESGSKKAHRVSAAALALANKLEGGEGAAVELAALKGAVEGEEGVIASAVSMVPKSAEVGVPTVADLQVKFDESYKIGRQAAMVPEGRAGLHGQLLGMFFAKLSVPPSPDAVPTSEEEGSVSDGILSLARKYVQMGDLEKAVEQLNRLNGQTAYVMNDWKSKAMDRVATERALKVIKLECALLNKDLVEP